MPDEDLAWMADAYCRRIARDPATRARVMFPDPPGHKQTGTDAGVDRAKAICRRCDVQAECLAYALNTGEDYGVWGGMSADERRLILNQHRSFAS
jgi:hypothetical protein